MNTVTFTRVADGVSKRSYADWGLLLRPKKIPAPEPKFIMMGIEGRDGDIDLTEWAGEVRYQNRSFPLSFYMTDPVPDVTAKATEIRNWMHGQRVKITFSEDAEYYFLARVSVPDAHIEGGVGMLTVNVITEPYKYKQQKTVINKTIDGTQAIVLTNARKRATPEITIDTTGSMNVVYHSSLVWDLGSGVFTLPELELTQGDNVVTVTGTGTITFSWQEGAL